MLKEKSESVFHNSSKVTQGVNTIFFFLGIQHTLVIQEKREQQCLTNMYVYTYFFFFFKQEYTDKLVFKRE